MDVQQVAVSAVSRARLLLSGFLDETIGDLARQMRWSFLPPLMVYFAAGLSGATAIVGTFYVKEYLGLSASFLAGLGFWAGLPWALKMPLGHLVDLIWRWKALLVYAGAALIAASLGIMVLLVSMPATMTAIMSAEAWYVLSVLLAPCGYVLQDAVADAMSVEAVPRIDTHGQPLSDDKTRALHTTMQTLGRIALISGLVAVSLLNITMFAGIEALDKAATKQIYVSIYTISLLIPVFSVSGVVLASVLRWRTRTALAAKGLSDTQIEALIDRPLEPTEPNYWYFWGGLAFVAMTLTIGLTDPPFAQEIVFAGSMAIVIVLMRQLAAELPPGHATALFGTAIIVFVFRAVPLPGAGQTWFEIDVLGFDQQFLSILTLITSVLTLIGMVVLRPMLARHRFVSIIAVLTIAGSLLLLPAISLYYGLHHWTAALTGGIVDARFIAVLNTAIESPLGQVAMIPMLAWIARNAPDHLKATFFAVMASFTNLALSASSLLTRYLNEVFVITREVKDAATGAITTPADYSSLGLLLWTVAFLTLVAPLVTIWLVQRSALRTTD